MTMACPVCGSPFEPRGRRRHCSDACRAAAWRRRHAPEAPLPPPLPCAALDHVATHELAPSPGDGGGVDAQEFGHLGVAAVAGLHRLEPGVQTALLLVEQAVE